MAEPARYEDHDEDPVIRPDLRRMEEGDQQADAHKKQDDKTKKATKKDKIKSAALKKAEEKWGTASVVSGPAAGGLSDQVGKGFNPKDKSIKGRLGNVKYILNLPKGKRNKALIGLGVGGGFIGLIISIFLALIPLKIEHIVNNLEDRFLAGSSSAVEDETQHLFSGYIGEVITNWPHTSSCTDTLTDSGCIHIFTEGNPVSNLYHTWAQAGLEEKMAKDYGIEFKYNKESSSYYIKLSDETDAFAQANNKIPPRDLTGDVDMFDDTSAFTPSTRNEIRNQVRMGIKDETLFNRVMLHFKFGRLLEEKYGIKRCIIFCDQRDQLSDAVKAGKNAAKIMFVRRVITPRYTALGGALECLFDTGCAPNKEDASTADDVGDAELGGAPESAVDKSIRQQLQDLFDQFGGESDAQMEALYADIDNAGGLQSYLIEQVLTIVFDESTAQATTQAIDKALPIIGWINLAAQIFNGVETAGPKIKHLSYIVEASSAVSTYMLYRSYADEVKTGQANPTEVGQFNDSLGPQAQQPANSPDPNVGGTASAEQSPLYDNLIEGNQPFTSTTSGLLDSVVPAKAYAAAPAPSAPPSYLCNKSTPGNPVTPLTPSNPGLNCTEEVIGQGNGILNDLSNVLKNYPGFSTLSTVAGIWNNTLGKLIGLFGSIINLAISPVITALNATCKLPPPLQSPYCTAKNLIGSIISTMMKYVVSWLIPNPYGINQSGARTFAEMAGGADVAGNNYAQQGLGGEAISNSSVLAAYNSQQSEDQYAFEHESFFSRIFDTTSQFSLVSKVALAMPSNLGQSVQNTLSSFLQDPLGGLVHGVAAVLSIAHASAATTQPIYACPDGGTAPTTAAGIAAEQSDDMFCVTQYGYPANQIPVNVEKYWENNCSDNANVLAGQMTLNYNNAAANAANAEQSASSSSNPGNPQVPSGNATAYADPNTSMPVNTTTDPCLLIQATLGSSGAIFNPGLLTADDQADSGGTPTATSSSGQNFVAQAVDPTNESNNFFGLVFREAGAIGKSIGEQFKGFDIIWTSRWYREI
jgi:hypothetical protein